MESVFLAYLNSGVMACWTLLAVLLLRQLCKVCSRKIICFFWIPVAFRFLCPASLPSPVSFFNMLRSTVQRDSYLVTMNQYVPGDIGMMEKPQISVGIGTVDGILSSVLPGAEPAYSVNPMQVWSTVAAYIWIVGMAVMLVWAVVRYFLLRFQLRFAVRMDGMDDVYTGEMVSTPFLMGLVKPRIYLPLGLDNTLMETVLRHERAHIRYHDPFWKLAAWLVLTINWYNPLCWFAVLLFNRDMETRCDETVLETVDAKTYGTALVTLAAGKRFSPVAPLAFGESSVGSRVKHILRWKKPAAWVGIAAVVICVALIPVFATDGMVSPVQWTEKVTAAEMELVSGSLHEGDSIGIINLDAEQNGTLADILNQLREEDMSLSLIPKRSGQRYFWMKIHFHDLDAPQTLTYMDGVVYISSGETLFGRMVMWQVDSPALTGFLEGLFADVRMESVRWSGIRAVSVYATPAKVHKYDAMPSELGDILTDIENVPAEQRSIVYFDINEQSLLGVLHVDIEQTNGHLALVTLTVLFEDTVVVRYIDHLADDTQEEKTYFVFTDEKIASALLRYGDTLSDTGEPVVESDVDTSVSIVALREMENGYYLKTDEIDYSKIPTIPANGNRVFRLLVDTEEDLTVQEHYYMKMNDDSTIINSTIHTLTKDEDGLYTLRVKEMNPGKEEQAIYYVQFGEGRYVFRVKFNPDLPVIPLM